MGSSLNMKAEKLEKAQQLAKQESESKADFLARSCAVAQRHRLADTSKSRQYKMSCRPWLLAALESSPATGESADSSGKQLPVRDAT